MTDVILNNTIPFIGRTNQLLRARSYVSIKYGLLYNQYAVTDVRSITAAGWHLPTWNDFKNLLLFVDPSFDEMNLHSEIAGGKLKETGTTYWLHEYATNDYGFSMRGGGVRSEVDGSFYSIKSIGILKGGETYNGYPILLGAFISDSLTLDMGIDSGPNYNNVGRSIRAICDNTTLTHGQTGSYTGNDGKMYRTICINDQEWCINNLAETKYANGDPIPEITSNSSWIALTTGALCAYNNDWNNV